MNRLPTGWIRWLTVRVASNIDRLTRKPRLVSALGPPIAVAGSFRRLPTRPKPTGCVKRHNSQLHVFQRGSGTPPGKVGNILRFNTNLPGTVGSRSAPIETPLISRFSLLNQVVGWAE